jgi:rare lipoprotein A
MSSRRTWQQVLAGVSLLLIVLLVGCAAPSPPRAALPTGYPIGYVERGIASWYGPSFQGRMTASGETYHKWQLTAAHRTLPLGSIVLVRSLTTGRAVTVRINDRGPFTKDRILDLSQGAAHALGILGRGTDEVEIRVVAYHGAPQALGTLRVQVASFAELANAQALASRLRSRYQDVHVVPTDLPEGRRYRVRVGRFSSVREAEELASHLGTEFELDPLVIREDD